jgi:hypothetical protein
MGMPRQAALVAWLSAVQEGGFALRLVDFWTLQLFLSRWFMYPEDFEIYLRHNPTDVDKQTAFRLWVNNAKNFTKSGKPRFVAKVVKPLRKKRVDYRKYIKSKEWAARSKSFRQLQKTCEMCGTTKGLQCHHKHYRSLGREKRTDIMVVCCRCHCKLHGVDSFD